MAGKKKAECKSASGWGGRRPGSGRSRTVISEKVLYDLFRTFKKMAKEHGKTVPEILAEIIYDKRPVKNMQLKLRAIELYYNLLIVKQTEHKVEKVDIAVREVLIPPLQPDPAQINILPPSHEEYKN